MRKVMHSALSAKQVLKYASIEARENSALLIKLLEEPAEFRDHIRLYVVDYYLTQILN